MLRSFFAVLVVSLTGCAAFSTSVTPATGAPKLPPSTSAEVVHSPPAANAVEIAKIHAQGNNYSKPSECENQLVSEAKKAGANTVYVRTSDGVFGGGPACDGTAYVVSR